MPGTNPQGILDFLKFQKEVVNPDTGAVEQVFDVNQYQDFNKAMSSFRENFNPMPEPQGLLRQAQPQMPQQMMPQQMPQQMAGVPQPQQMQSLATPQYGIGGTPTIDQILAALQARQ